MTKLQEETNVTLHLSTGHSDFTSKQFAVCFHMQAKASSAYSILAVANTVLDMVRSNLSITSYLDTRQGNAFGKHIGISFVKTHNTIHF